MKAGCSLLFSRRGLGISCVSGNVQALQHHWGSGRGGPERGRSTPPRVRKAIAVSLTSFSPSLNSPFPFPCSCTSCSCCFLILLRLRNVPPPGSLPNLHQAIVSPLSSHPVSMWGPSFQASYSFARASFLVRSHSSGERLKEMENSTPEPPPGSSRKPWSVLRLATRELKHMVGRLRKVTLCQWERVWKEVLAQSHRTSEWQSHPGSQASGFSSVLFQEQPSSTPTQARAYPEPVGPETYWIMGEGEGSSLRKRIEN